MAFNPDVIGSIKPLTAHKFRKLKNSPTQKRIVWPRFIFSHLDQNLSVTATETWPNNSRIVTTITDNFATDSIASRTHHHGSNCHRLNIITIALLSFIFIIVNEKVRIILVNIESCKSVVSSSAQHQWSEGVVMQLGKGNLRNLCWRRWETSTFTYRATYQHHQNHPALHPPIHRYLWPWPHNFSFGPDQEGLILKCNSCMSHTLIGIILKKNSFRYI